MNKHMGIICLLLLVCAGTSFASESQYIKKPENKHQNKEWGSYVDRNGQLHIIGREYMFFVRYSNYIGVTASLFLLCYGISGYVRKKRDRRYPVCTLLATVGLITSGLYILIYDQYE